MRAFCSTSSTVVPCRLISSTISKMRSTKIGASPIEGSSRSRSFGRAISARPIAHLQRDALEGMDRAVVAVDVVDAEHDFGVVAGPRARRLRLGERLGHAV